MVSCTSVATHVTLQRCCLCVLNGVLLLDCVSFFQIHTSAAGGLSDFSFSNIDFFFNKWSFNDDLLSDSCPVLHISPASSMWPLSRQHPALLALPSTSLATSLRSPIYLLQTRQETTIVDLAALSADPYHQHTDTQAVLCRNDKNEKYWLKV